MRTSSRRVSVLDRPIDLETTLVGVLCVVLGAGTSVTPFAPIAGLAAIGLAPVLLRSARVYRLARLLLAALALSVVAGILLTFLGDGTHSLRPSLAVERSLMVAALAGGVLLIIHARSRLGTPAVALLYGIGMMVDAVLSPGSSNPWRFTYSIPVAVVVLALVAWHARFAVQVAALVLLSVTGIVFESRSNSAMLLVAAAALMWQRLALAVTRRRRRSGNVVGLILVAAGMYQLLQFSLTEGFFGDATQEKTEAQLNASGNILLGGRPEAAASLALIRTYPFGMGSGIQPTPTDILEAKTAMLAIGYDPNNGYVERFMFGNGIEVHSTVGDFWLWFGIAGALACALMVVIVFWGLQRHLVDASLTGLAAFLAIRFVWDLLFSPASSTMPLLTLTLGLIVPAISQSSPSQSRTSRVNATGGSSK